MRFIFYATCSFAKRTNKLYAKKEVEASIAKHKRSFKAEKKVDKDCLVSFHGVIKKNLANYGLDLCFKPQQRKSSFRL